MCLSCERQFGTCNGNNGIGESGDVANVVVKSEIGRLASEGLAPEIVIKVEENKNDSLKVEDRIGDFVAHGDDFEEEDEGFSYDEEDSEITYSEEEDDDDDDVKPQVIECESERSITINVVLIALFFLRILIISSSSTHPRKRCPEEAEESEGEREDVPRKIQLTISR